MKKLALTSLLAMFAVSGAHAANVIDNNPLYRPDAGRFYSVTDVASHSEHTNLWTLGEELGYGITDRLAVIVNTSAAEANWFDKMAWNDFGIGLNFRALDMGAWKGDVFARYAVGNVWPDHKPFLDEDLTNYTWTIGARAGYTTAQWTVAGHVAMDYVGGESFDWDEDGFHWIRAGVDGQLVLNSDWNLVAGVEYRGLLDDKIGGVKIKDAGKWTGELGLNYNIDATKFVGAYVSTELAHRTGDWEFEDGFGFGVKFGIDF